MIQVIAVLFIFMSAPLPPAEAQSDLSPNPSGGEYYSAHMVSRNRYIQQFKGQTAKQNFGFLVSLNTQSQYEFNRNLNWLKNYAHFSQQDEEFQIAFREFLDCLAIELKYFPDDIMLLVRIVEGLGETAVPIALNITSFMEINWSQRSVLTLDESALLKSTLILLNWHKDVEQHYSSNWRSLAIKLTSSDICKATPSCVKELSSY